VGSFLTFYRTFTKNCSPLPFRVPHVQVQDYEGRGEELKMKLEEKKSKRWRRRRLLNKVIVMSLQICIVQQTIAP
jgi:hypothetical protein